MLLVLLHTFLIQGGGRRPPENKRSAKMKGHCKLALAAAQKAAGAELEYLRVPPAPPSRSGSEHSWLRRTVRVAAGINAA